MATCHWQWQVRKAKAPPTPGGEIGTASDQNVARPDVGSVSLHTNEYDSQSKEEYLVFIAQVVGCRYENHWVNPLAVPFEGPHTSSLLVTLAQLRHIKEPGLCSLVKGGGEYEVAGEKDPEAGRRMRAGTLDSLLNPGCVPFVDKQALTGGHVPPRKQPFSTGASVGQKY